MNKDDMIRMAEKVGMYLYNADQFKINHGYRDVDIETIEKFANLVALVEREACLQEIGDLIRKHRDEKDGEPEGYPDIFDAYEAIRSRNQ